MVAVSMQGFLKHLFTSVEFWNIKGIGYILFLKNGLKKT
jgi:hypothetical protein